MGRGKGAVNRGAKAWWVRRRAAGLMVSAALTAVVVVVEMRKPKDERAWHGQLAGFVPYDLRVPTPSRILRSVWSPQDDRIFLPRAFGIGWSVNVGRIVRAVQEHRSPAS